jgi:hypothetical protein
VEARPRSDQDVDRVLDESFPASDPPPWTPAAAAVDVVIPRERRGLAKVGEAIVLVALLPIAVFIAAALIRGGADVIRLLTR